MYQTYKNVKIINPKGAVTGYVDLAWTDAGHVHIGTPNGQAVLLRDQAYYVSMHLYAETGWHLKPFERPHITRRSDDKAPPTYVDAIVAAVTHTVQEFLKTHPDAPRAAEYARALMEEERTLREIREAEAGLELLHTVLASVRERKESSAPDPILRPAFPLGTAEVVGT